MFPLEKSHYEKRLQSNFSCQNIGVENNYANIYFLLKLFRYAYFRDRENLVKALGMNGHLLKKEKLKIDIKKPSRWS